MGGWGGRGGGGGGGGRGGGKGGGKHRDGGIIIKDRHQSPPPPSSAITCASAPANPTVGRTLGKVEAEARTGRHPVAQHRNKPPGGDIVGNFGFGDIGSGPRPPRPRGQSSHDCRRLSDQGASTCMTSPSFSNSHS